MDTLISVGTLSAWLWSIYALFLGSAGDNGLRMVFNLIPPSGAGAKEIYLETASIVTTFILAGRYFEARAKRHAGAALKALLELGAKDVAILEPDGSERRVSIEQLQVGQRFIVRPGEKVATDGIVEDGPSAIDMSMLTGESVPVEVRPGSEIAGATINAGGRLIVGRPRSAATPRSRRSPGLARIGGAASPRKRRSRMPSARSASLLARSRFFVAADRSPRSPCSEREAGRATRPF
jgi:Cu+-exporting ATPase